jgi:competence protein ComEC
VVVPALEALHLDFLDYIVSSHPDADHCGGLDEIVKDVEVGEIWWSGIGKTTSTWQAFADAADAHDIPWTAVQRDDAATIDGCDVLVLNADQGWGGDDGYNDNSVVLSIACEDAVFLLTGDVTDSAQADIMDYNGEELASDFVKVPHHGSNDRDPGFADLVAPLYAVISVGAGNPYEHPDPGTIADWEGVGADVYRTDQDGTVIVRAKAGQFFVSTQP